MNQQDILDKMAKLYALSMSQNIGESEASKEALKKLSEKYGIEIDRVAANSSKIGYVLEQVSIEGSNTSILMRLSMTLASRFFNVNAYTEKSWDSNIRSRCVLYCFAGRKEDNKLAREFLAFFPSEVEKYYRLEKQEKKLKDGTILDKNSYVLGVYRSMTNKFEESRKQVEQEYGLVIVDNRVKRDEFLKNEHNIKLRSTKISPRIHRDSYDAGISRGKNMNLYKMKELK